MPASDVVYKIDKYQGTVNALSCEKKNHGRLTAHVSGAFLMCCQPGCETKVMASAEMMGN